MLQIYLTNSAANDLSRLLSDQGETDLQAMQWYAHRITVMEARCLIMMERKSRYCMLFSDLSETELANFPEIFYQRLWREVMSICQPLAGDADSMQAVIDKTMARQQYRRGADRSVQAHINDVAWQFQEQALQIGHLPKDASELFIFGMLMNGMLRKTQAERNDFVPRERFRRDWLERAGCAGESAEGGDGHPAANVVPFIRP